MKCLILWNLQSSKTLATVSLIWILYYERDVNEKCRLCKNVISICLLIEQRFRSTYQVVATQKKNWPFPFNTFIPLHQSYSLRNWTFWWAYITHISKMWINCLLFLDSYNNNETKNLFVLTRQCAILLS